MKRKLSLLLFALVLFFGCTDSDNDNSGWDVDTIEELSYVAIGASDAVGIGAVPETKGYVYLIEAELETFVTNLTFNNLGISGHTVWAMIQDTLEDKEDELAEAIAIQPDLITIWAGGNSFTEILEDAQFAAEDEAVQVVQAGVAHFGMGLDSLIKTLKDSIPNVKIVIANLPDMSQLPAVAEFGEDAVTAGKSIILFLNSVIKTQADKYGVPMVDLYAHSDEILQSDYVADDGFHPGNKGYAFMAEEYMDKIADLLK